MHVARRLAVFGLLILCRRLACSLHLQSTNMPLCCSFCRGQCQSHAVQRQGLRLRGGSRRGKSFLELSAKKELFTDQARALERRKRVWRERFGDSGSDDVEEEVDDPDRPDYYKRPLASVPNDDFAQSGLPAWLDPIYDNVDPEEYLKAELQDEDDELNEIGWEADIDSSDLVELGTDPVTGEPKMSLKPLPGDESFSDKEYTFSEMDELERLWNWNERNFGRRATPSQDSDDDSELAALPWEEEAEKERKQRGESESLYLEAGTAHNPLDLELPAHDGSGAAGPGLQPTTDRAAVSQNDLEDPRADKQTEGAWPDDSTQNELADSEGTASPVLRNAKRAQERSDGLAAPSHPEFNYTAMFDQAMIVADDERLGAGPSAMVSSGLEDGWASGPPPPQYDNDNWPFEPGVCAPDRHPLEYQVSEERIRYWSSAWLRPDFDFEGMLANFSMPEEERRRQEAIEAAWGFCPAPGQAIAGFNAWNTSEPAPPSPPVVGKPGDCTVPDRHPTIPLAVRACEDGGRVLIRGGSNHTWLGQGLRKRKGRLVDRYDGELMSTPRPPAEEALVFGRLMVPPSGSGEPAVGLAASELGGEGGEGGASFCMHVAGEQGARVGGRWLLQPSSLGSFTGVDSVFEVNESKIELPLQPLLSTVEVRGGPWLLQHCGLRSCGAVAVDCTRRSLVKARQCAIGGISHQREDHAAGGRAVMGVFCRDFARCVLASCTVELTGWFLMPAIRCAGVAQVSVQRCELQRNTYAVGIVDKPSVQISHCTTRHNDQAAFVAAQYQGPVTGGGLAASPPPEPQQALWELELEATGCRYPIPKLAQQVVMWDRGKQEWRRGNARPTVRVDPLFGNLTDGWPGGLPGWTHGVPQSVSGLPEQGGWSAPECLRRWGSGRVGCAVSQRVANGSLPGDMLTVGFNGGAHEAKLAVADSAVFGRVWGTRGRPGTLRMSNVTEAQDAWVEKFLGNATQRRTARQSLEAMGLRWDARRRTFTKPIRMANGTIVRVRWNETRFSDEVAGGYPGQPEDYPMFDPVSLQRLVNRNMSKRAETRRHALLGYEEAWHEEDQALWEYRRQKARRHRLRAEARRRSEAAEQEQLTAWAGGGQQDAGGAARSALAVRDANSHEGAVSRLLHKYLTRHTREDPCLEAMQRPPHLLDRQPR